MRQPKQRQKITNCPPHGPRAQFCGNTHLNFYTGQPSAISVWRDVALMKIVFFGVTLSSGIVHISIWRIFVCEKNAFFVHFVKFCGFIFWNACFCSVKAFGGCARFSARFFKPWAIWRQFGSFFVLFWVLFLSLPVVCLFFFLFLWLLLVLFLFVWLLFSVCCCWCCCCCFCCCFLVVVFHVVVSCCCFFFLLFSCCCCCCYCPYLPQNTLPK